jgi:hypothetical protein
MTTLLKNLAVDKRWHRSNLSKTTVSTLIGSSFPCPTFVSMVLDLEEQSLESFSSGIDPPGSADSADALNVIDKISTFLRR